MKMTFSVFAWVVVGARMRATRIGSNMMVRDGQRMSVCCCYIFLRLRETSLCPISGPAACPVCSFALDKNEREVVSFVARLFVSFARQSKLLVHVITGRRG